MGDFNTPLTLEEEQNFQKWKQQYAPNDSGADYDLRGAFKDGLTPDAQTGHWPDTYKKPNHPTFSDESKYAPYGNPGHWQGNTFLPGKQPTQSPSLLEKLMQMRQEGARATQPQEYNPQPYRGNPTTPPTYSDTPSMFPNAQRAGDLSPPINNMNRAINRGTPTQLESMMNDPEGNEWLSKLPKSLLQQLFSNNLATMLNNTQFGRAVQVNNRYIDESKYLGQDWKTSPDWDMTGRKM